MVGPEVQDSRGSSKRSGLKLVFSASLAALAALERTPRPAFWRESAREGNCRVPQREPTYEMAVAFSFGGALAGRDRFLSRWWRILRITAGSRMNALWNGLS